MYVVRMIEAVKSLCYALRCVMIELDATGLSWLCESLDMWEEANNG